MITVDLLNENEILNVLTDEQKSAIATLSESNENEVIGNRFGEVYRQMDSTIEEATGIKRDGAEKTYLYLKRAANEFASKYKDYDELKEKVSSLTEQLKSGNGDTALKAQLESTQRELNAVKEQYSLLKGEYESAESKYKSDLLNYQIDNELTRAKDGIKLKGGLSDFAVETLVSKAITNVKAKNPSFEERNGKTILIFRDEEGAPLLNRENAMNPFSAKELLTREFEALGILEKKPGTGAGGNGNLPKSGFVASTQVEADEVIAKMLSERGLTKTDPRYYEELKALRKQYNVSDLPLK